MLIQITNRCTMGCSHCMQDSQPDGEHMTREIMSDVLQFIYDNKVSFVCISGGEPSMHPDLYGFCQILDSFGTRFIISSNGMFLLEDLDRMENMVTISRLQSCMGIQIYSHPDFYKRYNEILTLVPYFKALNPDKIYLITDRIQAMKNLGRARTSEKAQEYIQQSKYLMSCVNGHLVARQANSMYELIERLNLHGMNCHPMIDYKGDFHLSESHLCPSFGNIHNTNTKDIFRRMQTQKPCMKCTDSHRLIETKNPSLVKVREILGV